MPALHRTIAAATISILVLTACGGDNEVGSDDLLEFDQDEAAGLGASSTTATSLTTDTSLTTETTAGQTATTVQSATTLPPEEQVVTVEVIIQDDEQGAPFTPNTLRVLVGSKVRFLNKGTKPYAIMATNGAFGSPPIAPGTAWIYDANTPGNFTFTDDVRTYAVGKLEVVNG
jgi:plastocyanin